MSKGKIHSLEIEKMMFNAHKWGLTLVGLCFSLFSNAQTFKPMEKQALNSTQQEVLQAVQHMTDAFHRKDIKGVMDSYEPNALVVFDPQNPIQDAGALQERFLQTFGISPRFEYSGHEVFVNGNLGIHLAPWTMTATAPDGTAIQQTGLSIAVLRQQKDGKWLMVFDDPHGQFLMEQ